MEDRFIKENMVRRWNGNNVAVILELVNLGEQDEYGDEIYHLKLDDGQELMIFGHMKQFNSKPWQLFVNDVAVRWHDEDMEGTFRGIPLCTRTQFYASREVYESFIKKYLPEG